ncbi:MAG TPA: EamA family transporter [Actinomycetales bacterium]|nr:EamA family transporter [Actinomycetales bacterium]
MNRRAALLFAGLSIAWGIPYLLIKISVDEISPLALVLFRTALGALLLLPLAFARGAIWPVLRRWRVVVLYTAVEISVPWWLLSHAETRLSSSLSGLMIATVPLAGIGVGMLTRRRERLGLAGVAGLALGLLGVAFLVGVDVGGSDLFAVAELVVVVICYAFGAALMGHHLGDLPTIGVVAVSLSAAAVAYLPLSLVLPGSLPAAVPSAEVVVSVLLLAVVSTAGAFLLMFGLVAELGPVRATTFTYVNPAVAIVAGAVVLHEPITPATGVGFVLVLLGSVLVTSRPRSLAAQVVAPGVVAPDVVAVPGPTISGTTILGPSTEPVLQPLERAEARIPLQASCGSSAEAG